MHTLSSWAGLCAQALNVHTKSDPSPICKFMRFIRFIERYGFYNHYLFCYKQDRPSAVRVLRIDEWSLIKSNVFGAAESQLFG